MNKQTLLDLTKNDLANPETFEKVNGAYRYKGLSHAIRAFVEDYARETGLPHDLIRDMVVTGNQAEKLWAYVEAEQKIIRKELAKQEHAQSLVGKHGEYEITICESDKRFLRLAGPYDKGLVEQLRKIGRWDSWDRAWHIPIDKAKRLEKTLHDHLKELFPKQVDEAIIKQCNGTYGQTSVRYRESERGKVFWIEGPYDEFLVPKLRNLKGSRFEKRPRNGVWTVPVTEGPALLEALKAYEAELDRRHQEWIRKQEERAREREEQRRERQRYYRNAYRNQTKGHQEPQET
ncbi:MAG: hypothetical protein D6806_15280, partial [Deltaproteobacteria bacterium]